MVGVQVIVQSQLLLWPELNGALEEKWGGDSGGGGVLSFSGFGLLDGVI